MFSEGDIEADSSRLSKLYREGTEEGKTGCVWTGEEGENCCEGIEIMVYVSCVPLPIYEVP